jgi:hypothetical protein
MITFLSMQALESFLTLIFYGQFMGKQARQEKGPSEEGP